MQGRTRMLIIVAFVIVLLGVGAAFILPSLNQAPAATQAANTTPGAVAPPSNTTSGGATAQPTYTPFPTGLIVVAVQNLSRGVVIPANAVDVRPWPQEMIPISAILATEAGGIPEDVVIGKIARTDIQREQPILQTMLVENLTQLAKVGSDAAAVLPPGTVAVAVPMDRLTGIAYALQDGDRVDVIISLLFVDVDQAFQSKTPNLITLFTQTEDGLKLGAQIQGRPETTTLGPGIITPSEGQRPRLVTQRTIQDALVLHVGDFPLDGRLFRVQQATSTPAPTEAGQSAQAAARNTPVPPTPLPPPPDIVTLGVTPQDAVMLIWTVEAAMPVSFALRSAGDTSKVPTEPVTLDYVMSTYRINVPGKTDYNIEPAIRSIRRLIIGELQALGTSGGGN